jgi:hypothetical protein
MDKLLLKWGDVIAKKHSQVNKITSGETVFSAVLELDNKWTHAGSVVLEPSACLPWNLIPIILCN